ncbi:uncharacterized protein LOC62_01G001533 [Vanrija pseudolonga]|uniref:Uncharacterized protein n=1 Tax=Vanrija pseudolonga TaxID=143232 RepID=A0AAF1BFF1_9TREE|nr:hypothetical protein LOC62_01G001533 [Vanrija pseudolonga]
MFSPLTLIFRAMSLLDNRHDWVESDTDAVCRFCVRAMAERSRRAEGEGEGGVGVEGGVVLRGEWNSGKQGLAYIDEDAATGADTDADTTAHTPTPCCETSARWHASLKSIELEQALFLSLPIVCALGASGGLMAFGATTAVYCASCGDTVPVMFWLFMGVAAVCRRLLKHMARRVLPLIHHRAVHAFLESLLHYAMLGVVLAVVTVAFVLEHHNPSAYSHRLALALAWCASLWL